MWVWTCIVDTGSTIRVTMLLIVMAISDCTHQPCFRSIVMCPETVPVDPTRTLEESQLISRKLHGLPSFSFTVHLVANRAIWEKAGKANLLPREDDGSRTYDQFLTSANNWPLGSALSFSLTAVVLVMLATYALYAKARGQEELI